MASSIQELARSIKGSRPSMIRDSGVNSRTYSREELASLKAGKVRKAQKGQKKTAPPNPFSRRSRQEIRERRVRSARKAQRLLFEEGEAEMAAMRLDSVRTDGMVESNEASPQGEMEGVAESIEASPQVEDDDDGYTGDDEAGFFSTAYRVYLREQARSALTEMGEDW